MLKNLSADMLATDLADEMVRKGCPFREAHHKSGQLVAMAEAKNVSLSHLPLCDFQTVFPLFGPEIVGADWWSYSQSVERRDSIGGTSKRRVIGQISWFRSRYSQHTHTESNTAQPT
jgi:argininosuccinate lyase